ncbi:MAG: hypothetical protein Q8O86_04505 [Dehalococcoidia bacterium]|nr:hypothetical protein [Dehalococcoidia bacterium]
MKMACLGAPASRRQAMPQRDIFIPVPHAPWGTTGDENGITRMGLPEVEQASRLFAQARGLCHLPGFIFIPVPHASWGTTGDENRPSMPQRFSLGCSPPPQAKALGHGGTVGRSYFRT